MAFIDFCSAFHAVDRPSVWLILKAAGLPTKIVSLFMELYSNTETAILVNGKLSSFILIQNGVRWGYAAATELLNRVIDHVLNETHLAHPFSISYAGRTLFSVAFADNVAVLSDNLNQLNSALETPSFTASRAGLQINWKKTKIMLIEKTAWCFVLDAEVSARSAKGSSVFERLLRAFFHKRKISNHTKAQIFNTTVWSIMLYSSETWPITQTQQRRVDAVQARHLRRVEGCKWYDKIRNILIPMNFKLASLSTQVEARSFRWYGHLLRLPLSTPQGSLWTSIPRKMAGNAPEEGHALNGMM